MKAPLVMADAVRKVDPRYRLAAAKLAERSYFMFFDRLEKLGDYHTDTNKQMAADAAAAEVAFYFH